MFCANCKKDTGNKSECPHCGYNPMLDAEGAAPHNFLEYTEPKPVRIVLNKIHNGKAKAAFVLSFFGFCIVPGIISFFLSLGGLAQAKKCRSGRGLAIAALIINGFWVWVFIMAIIGSMQY